MPMPIPVSMRVLVPVLRLGLLPLWALPVAGD
jgi:hypothetical protein